MAELAAETILSQFCSTREDLIISSGELRGPGNSGGKRSGFPFSYPLYSHCASFVNHSSAEGVDTKDVKKKSM